MRRMSELPDSTGMTPSPTCCGRPTRDVTLNLPSQQLVIAFCGRCERRKWLSDGAPIDPATAQLAVAAVHNRKVKADNHRGLVAA